MVHPLHGGSLLQTVVAAGSRSWRSGLHVEVDRALTELFGLDALHVPCPVTLHRSSLAPLCGFPPTRRQPCADR